VSTPEVLTAEEEWSDGAVGGGDDGYSDPDY